MGEVGWESEMEGKVRRCVLDGLWNRPSHIIIKRQELEKEILSMPAKGTIYIHMEVYIIRQSGFNNRQYTSFMDWF